MTQPSSLDFNLPESSLLFMARSSPFICVADTLEVLIALRFYMYQEGNIFEAARLVNWSIARARLGNGVSGLEVSAAEKHPKTFLILFVVTLVQAVKVLGLQGLPWTRVWAGIYLCSYVVLAIVRALAPKGWRDRPPWVTPLGENPSFQKKRQEKRLGTIRTVLLVVGSAVHASVSCWALTYVQRQYEDINEGSDLMSIILFGREYFSTYVSTMLIFCIPYLMYDHCRVVGITRISIGSLKFNHEFDSIWVPIMASILILFGVLSLMVGLDPEFTVKYLQCFHGVTSIALCFGLLFLLFTIMSVLSKKVPFLGFLKFNDGDYRALLIFPFFNFIVAFLYYRYAYDPIGTVKSLWTEELG